MSWEQLARVVYRRTAGEHVPPYGPDDLSGAGLTWPQERAIRYRWALDPEPLTLDQVGKIMGVSRERVRQMEMVALSKLRAALHEGAPGKSGGSDGP